MARSAFFCHIFNIERGDRIALVGVNGAGKSTLIRILSGEEPVTSGEYVLGHNVETDYFAQDQYKALNTESPFWTIWGQSPRDRPIRNCAGFSVRFYFRRTMSSSRSGCFRRRTQPLRAGPHADEPGNFMLLDEPTNHLECAPRTCC